MKSGLRTREVSGVSSTRRNFDLGALASVQRQTYCEIPIFSLVVLTASIYRHRRCWYVGGLPAKQNIATGLGSVVFQPETAREEPHINSAVLSCPRQAGARANCREVCPFELFLESVYACDKSLKSVIPSSKIIVVFNGQGRLSQEEVESEFPDVTWVATAKKRKIIKLS